MKWKTPYEIYKQELINYYSNPNNKMDEELKQKLIAAGREDLIEAAETIASGYAGIKSTGEIVDRRISPYAEPVSENPMLGIPEPKRLSYNVLKRLTKENFFNYLYELSNGAFQSFCDWIDEYKKRIGWEDLFGWERDIYVVQIGGSRKYHDIPIAMQLGIMAEYFVDMGVSWEFFGDLEDILSEIIEYWYQKGLKPEKFEFDRVVPGRVDPDGPFGKEAQKAAQAHSNDDPAANG